MYSSNTTHSFDFDNHVNVCGQNLRIKTDQNFRFREKKNKFTKILLSMDTGDIDSEYEQNSHTHSRTRVIRNFFGLFAFDFSMYSRWETLSIR